MSSKIKDILVPKFEEKLAFCKHPPSKASGFISKFFNPPNVYPNLEEFTQEDVDVIAKINSEWKEPFRVFHGGCTTCITGYVKPSICSSCNYFGNSRPSIYYIPAADIFFGEYEHDANYKSLKERIKIVIPFVKGKYPEKFI